MNLSARLSTAANIGDLDNRAMRRKLILGNLSLLQVQALLVSSVAAMLSFLLGIILGPSAPSTTPEKETPTLLLLRAVIASRRPKYHPPKTSNRGGPREFFIVLATALCSASASSLILGTFMCALVVLCRKGGLNPDNIAPPVASALGDLLTLTLLGLISAVIQPMPPAVLAILLIIIFIGFVACFILTTRNTRVKHLLAQGWTPLFGAMAISSGAGLVLDKFVLKWESFGMLSIIIGGIPGSVGSVYISRLSTTLHALVHGSGHSLPAAPNGAAATPTSIMTPRTPRSLIPANPELSPEVLQEARPFVSALALFLVTLPVQLGFIVIAYLVGWISLPPLFVVGFVFFFCITVRPCLSE